MGLSSMIQQPVGLCSLDRVCHSASQIIIIAGLGDFSSVAALLHRPGSIDRSFVSGSRCLWAGL